MKLSNPKVAEFVRFCLVGLAATAIHYGLYLALIHGFRIEREIWINVSYTIGYLVSWCVNLYLTAHFTFKEEVTVKRGIGFAVSHVINYALHIVFLNLFLHVGVPQQFAPIPVYCVVVPINFVLVRTVFKRLK